MLVLAGWIAFLLLALIPLMVWRIVGKDPGQTRATLLFTVLLCYFCAASVLFAEIGAVYLAGNFLGGVEINSFFLFAAAILVYSVLNMIYQLVGGAFLTALARILFKRRLPEAILLAVLFPTSVVLLLQISDAMNQRISIVPAIMITLLTSVLSLLLSVSMTNRSTAASSGRTLE